MAALEYEGAKRSVGPIFEDGYGLGAASDFDEIGRPVDCPINF
jgi:hypothetical protein